MIGAPPSLRCARALLFPAGNIVLIVVVVLVRSSSDTIMPLPGQVLVPAARDKGSLAVIVEEVKRAPEWAIPGFDTQVEDARIGAGAVILEDGTCCYIWGIRKWDDGPIEISAPIAYPKQQKGAAPRQTGWRIQAFLGYF
jgi:hypothetical protein